MANQRKSLRQLMITVCVAVGVSACGSDMGDLRAYVDEVKARPGGRIEPLPEIRPAPSFAYVADDRRSPFMPDSPQARANNNPDAIQGPDPTRAREFLEQFPLDTMRMVGTMTMNSVAGTFGLVQTSDGLIHRVTVGHHLGQNYGRIMTISESEIELVEIIADGIGGYLERPAAVALTD